MTDNDILPGTPGDKGAFTRASLAHYKKKSIVRAAFGETSKGSEALGLVGQLFGGRI